MICAPFCTRSINNSKDVVCEHSPLVSYPCESSGTKRVFSEISPLSHEFHTDSSHKIRTDANHRWTEVCVNVVRRKQCPLARSDCLPCATHEKVEIFH